MWGFPPESGWGRSESVNQTVSSTSPPACSWVGRGLVRAGLSVAEVLALPSVVDVVTAGRALGMGRTKSYQLARSGQFPCRVIEIGASYVVPTAELLTLLGLPVPGRPSLEGR